LGEERGVVGYAHVSQIRAYVGVVEGEVKKCVAVRNVEAFEGWRFHCEAFRVIRTVNPKPNECRR
jgi:hypothetical protein